MKKLITSLLIVSTLLCSAFTAVSAAENGTSYGKVPATEDAITVDGKKDAVYDKGLKVVSNIANANNKTKSGASATSYLVWNGKDTIYVFCEVTDKEVIEYTGKPTSAWETDSVEIFFDYSNKVARTRDQYRIDVMNFATYYDTKTYENDDTKAFGFEKWGAAKTSTGYCVEFQIKAYKEAISADMKIGFFAMLNDMVKEGRNMFDSDKTGNTPASFGYITLSGEKVTGIVKKAEAAATADMSVVMAAVAMASGAVLVFKKRK